MEFRRPPNWVPDFLSYPAYAALAVWDLAGIAADKILIVADRPLDQVHKQANRLAIKSGMSGLYQKVSLKAASKIDVISAPIAGVATSIISAAGSIRDVVVEKFHKRRERIKNEKYIRTEADKKLFAELFDKKCSATAAVADERCNALTKTMNKLAEKNGNFQFTVLPERCYANDGTCFREIQTNIPAAGARDAFLTIVVSNKDIVMYGSSEKNGGAPERFKTASFASIRLTNIAAKFQ